MTTHAFADLQEILRSAFSEFEGSDDLPSEAARGALIRILTHERLIEARDEAVREAATRRPE